MNFYDHTSDTTYSDAELQENDNYSGGVAVVFSRGNGGIAISHFLECYAEANPQLVTYIQTYYPEACL